MPLKIKRFIKKEKEEDVETPEKELKHHTFPPCIRPTTHYLLALFDSDKFPF